MRLTGVSCLLLLVSLVCGTGCGDGSGSSSRKLVKVTGVVTLDGKPLSQGTISFVTEGQGAMNAAGEISSSGYYTLSTTTKGDGVPPGVYKVRIESWETPPTMDERGVNPGKSAIPDKYKDISTSGLNATINDSGRSQEFNFDLKS